MINHNFMDRYKTFASAVFNVGKDSIAEDAFSNPIARMGYGTPSVAEGVDYILNRWTNDYWLMITLFRNHWIPRKVIEIPAKDMVKAWPRLNCKLTPDQIADFDRTIKRTLTPKKIKRSITWARLFGGAGALMVIKGHENILDKPLKLDDINPDSYKGLIVFDRWSGITPIGNEQQDVESPLTFGLPEFYGVHGQNGNEKLFDIHASRILRFTGPDVPTPEHEANQYWGISVLELVMEEMRKRDNASWSILQLLFRAQVMTQVNPELAQMLSGATSGGAALTKFAQTYQAQNELLSNQSMLILGKEGKLESHQYTFGGIADVLDRFEIAVAASSTPSIPYSKLFGKNSSGLDNSNDADERNYEEAIAQAQSDDLEPQLMQQLYPVICMSEFGDVPDDLDITWPSIRVLTEEDKVKLSKDGTEAILAPFNAGVTSQQLTLKELKQLGDKTEIMTNVTDKMIDEADDKPQAPIEVEQGEARAGTAEFEEK
jgi:phage-related protein (TIGR01555 family)